ncbi:hypothetical protein FOPE_01068 [Fonsecaea pedrosoi]|nr:hypothetical protein FOPE_01068 [Fonsecaea pedrosoi]
MKLGRCRMITTKGSFGETYPEGQRLHSIHDGAVKAIRGLHDEHHAEPAIELPQMLVLVPWFVQQFLHINGRIPSLRTDDNLILLRSHA